MKPIVSPKAARAALVALLVAASAATTFAQPAPTFTVRGPAAIGEAGPQDAVAADFDKDGDLDLIVTTAGLVAPGAPPAHKVNFLMNDGTGLLAKQSALSVPGATRVAVADFNGDGASDLAVTVAPGGLCGMPPGVAVFLASGSVLTQSGFCLSAGFSPQAIQAADFNSDSLVDLAVANTDGSGIFVFRGNGSGGFQGFQQPARLNDSSIGVRDMATPVDVNGNHLDIVVGFNAGFRAFLGQGDGTFITGGNTTPGGQTLAIAVGDVTGDGIADLAELSSASYRVDRGVGNGSFGVGADQPIGPGMQDLALADMDSDGDLDIVIAGGAVGVGTRLFLNNGTGTFVNSPIPQTGPNPVRAVVGDFNRDGSSDVAIVDGALNHVAVLLQEDKVAPTVDITTPADGSTVSGTVPVRATAADNVGVARVDFFANDVLIGSSNGPEFSVSWNSSGHAGPVTIRARAFDANSNFADDSVSVNVADLVAPSAPANLTGRSLDNFHFVRLNWTAATDNVGVTHYKVYELVRIDSRISRWQLVKSRVEGTTAIVEITGRRGRAHTFGVTAVDAAGNESDRSVVEVSRDGRNRDRDDDDDDDRDGDRDDDRDRDDDDDDDDDRN